MHWQLPGFSQPLAGSPSQSCQPSSQAPRPHCPIEQVAAAWNGSGHGSQPPQWAGSASGSTQTSPQQARPPAHAWVSLQPATQAPSWHTLPGAQPASAVQPLQVWSAWSQVLGAVQSPSSSQPG
ncbi:hypothetical protein [Nannocystis pusilla]|uniref:hypothetical protein n=1 Tax=Nannocystis pusilla TaxID=889268 RepID=UPI003DA67EFE